MTFSLSAFAIRYSLMNKWHPPMLDKHIKVKLSRGSGDIAFWSSAAAVSPDRQEEGTIDAKASFRTEADGGCLSQS